MNLRINSSISTTPLFKNKSFLNQKYAVEGLSARQIAVLIGCGHSTINSALVRLQIAKEEKESGWVKYGTKMVEGKRVLHAREQQVIASILRKRKMGWSYQTISDWLSKRGIKSPAGQTRWFCPTIRRIENANRPREQRARPWA